VLSVGLLKFLRARGWGTPCSSVRAKTKTTCVPCLQVVDRSTQPDAMNAPGKESLLGVVPGDPTAPLGKGLVLPLDVQPVRFPPRPSGSHELPRSDDAPKRPHPSGAKSRRRMERGTSSRSRTGGVLLQTSYGSQQLADNRMGEYRHRTGSLVEPPEEEVAEPEDAPADGAEIHDKLIAKEMTIWQEFQSKRDFKIAPAISQFYLAMFLIDALVWAVAPSVRSFPAELVLYSPLGAPVLTLLLVMSLWASCCSTASRATREKYACSSVFARVSPLFVGLGVSGVLIAGIFQMPILPASVGLSIPNAYRIAIGAQSPENARQVALANDLTSAYELRDRTHAYAPTVLNVAVAMPVVARLVLVRQQDMLVFGGVITLLIIVVSLVRTFWLAHALNSAPGVPDEARLSDFPSLLSLAHGLSCILIGLIVSWGLVKLREFESWAGFVQRKRLQLQAIRAEELLTLAMPRQIAHKLMAGELDQRYYASASVAFIYIAGYKDLVYQAEDDLLGLIDDLHQLYCRFDALVLQHESVYKIESVANCYMVAAGIPDECNDHAPKMLRFCLSILELCRHLRRENPELDWRLKIGINSGPVTSGVVGLSRTFFRLFGDTVNTASRMGTNGQADRVHISRDTYCMLGEPPVVNPEMEGTDTVALGMDGEELGRHFVFGKVDGELSLLVLPPEEMLICEDDEDDDLFDDDRGSRLSNSEEDDTDFSESVEIPILGYTVEARGEIPVKGKGKVRTYFVDLPPSVFDDDVLEDDEGMDPEAAFRAMQDGPPLVQDTPALEALASPAAQVAPNSEGDLVPLRSGTTVSGAVFPPHSSEGAHISPFGNVGRSVELLRSAAAKAIGQQQPDGGASFFGMATGPTLHALNAVAKFKRGLAARRPLDARRGSVRVRTEDRAVAAGEGKPARTAGYTGFGSLLDHPTTFGLSDSAPSDSERGSKADKGVRSSRQNHETKTGSVRGLFNPFFAASGESSDGVDDSGKKRRSHRGSVRSSTGQVDVTGSYALDLDPSLLQQSAASRGALASSKHRSVSLTRGALLQHVPKSDEKPERSNRRSQTTPRQRLMKFPSSEPASSSYTSAVAAATMAGRDLRVDTGEAVLPMPPLLKSNASFSVTASRRPGLLSSPTADRDMLPVAGPSGMADVTDGGGSSPRNTSGTASSPQHSQSSPRLVKRTFPPQQPAGRGRRKSIKESFTQGFDERAGEQAKAIRERTGVHPLSPRSLARAAAKGDARARWARRNSDGGALLSSDLIAEALQVLMPQAEESGSGKGKRRLSRAPSVRDQPRSSSDREVLDVQRFALLLARAGGGAAGPMDAGAGMLPSGSPSQSRRHSLDSTAGSQARSMRSLVVGRTSGDDSTKPVEESDAKKLEGASQEPTKPKMMSAIGKDRARRRRESQMRVEAARAHWQETKAKLKAEMDAGGPLTQETLAAAQAAEAALKAAEAEAATFEPFSTSAPQIDQDGHLVMHRGQPPRNQDAQEPKRGRQPKQADDPGSAWNPPRRSSQPLPAEVRLERIKRLIEAKHRMARLRKERRVKDRADAKAVAIEAHDAALAAGLGKAEAEAAAKGAARDLISERRRRRSSIAVVAQQLVGDKTGGGQPGRRISGGGAVQKRRGSAFAQSLGMDVLDASSGAFAALTMSVIAQRAGTSGDKPNPDGSGSMVGASGAYSPSQEARKALNWVHVLQPAGSNPSSVSADGMLPSSMPASPSARTRKALALAHSSQGAESEAVGIVGGSDIRPRRTSTSSGSDDSDKESVHSDHGGARLKQHAGGKKFDAGQLFKQAQKLQSHVRRMRSQDSVELAPRNPERNPEAVARAQKALGGRNSAPLPISGIVAAKGTRKRFDARIRADSGGVSLPAQLKVPQATFDAIKPFMPPPVSVQVPTSPVTPPSTLPKGLPPKGDSSQRSSGSEAVVQVFRPQTSRMSEGKEANPPVDGGPTKAITASSGEALETAQGFKFAQMLSRIAGELLDVPADRAIEEYRYLHDPVTSRCTHHFIHTMETAYFKRYLNRARKRRKARRERQKQLRQARLRRMAMTGRRSWWSWFIGLPDPHSLSPSLAIELPLEEPGPSTDLIDIGPAQPGVWKSPPSRSQVAPLLSRQSREVSRHEEHPLSDKAESPKGSGSRWIDKLRASGQGPDSGGAHHGERVRSRRLSRRVSSRKSSRHSLSHAAGSRRRQSRRRSGRSSQGTDDDDDDSDDDGDEADHQALTDPSHLLRQTLNRRRASQFGIHADLSAPPPTTPLLGPQPPGKSLSPKLGPMTSPEDAVSALFSEPEPVQSAPPPPARRTRRKSQEGQNIQPFQGLALPDVTSPRVAMPSSGARSGPAHVSIPGSSPASVPASSGSRSAVADASTSTGPRLATKLSATGVESPPTSARLLGAPELAATRQTGADASLGEPAVARSPALPHGPLAVNPDATGLLSDSAAMPMMPPANSPTRPGRSRKDARLAARQARFEMEIESQKIKRAISFQAGHQPLTRHRSGRKGLSASHNLAESATSSKSGAVPFGASSIARALVEARHDHPEEDRGSSSSHPTREAPQPSSRETKLETKRSFGFNLFRGGKTDASGSSSSIAQPKNKSVKDLKQLLQQEEAGQHLPASAAGFSSDGGNSAGTSPGLRRPASEHKISTEEAASLPSGNPRSGRRIKTGPSSTRSLGANLLKRRNDSKRGRLSTVAETPSVGNTATAMTGGINAPNTERVRSRPLLMQAIRPLAGVGEEQVDSAWVDLASSISEADSDESDVSSAPSRHHPAAKFNSAEGLSSRGQLGPKTHSFTSNTSRGNSKTGIRGPKSTALSKTGSWKASGNVGSDGRVIPADEDDVNHSSALFALRPRVAVDSVASPPLRAGVDSGGKQAVSIMLTAAPLEARLSGGDGQLVPGTEVAGNRHSSGAVSLKDKPVSVFWDTELPPPPPARGCCQARKSRRSCCRVARKRWRKLSRSVEDLWYKLDARFDDEHTERVFQAIRLRHLFLRFQSVSSAMIVIAIAMLAVAALAIPSSDATIVAPILSCCGCVIAIQQVVRQFAERWNRASRYKGTPSVDNTGGDDELEEAIAGATGGRPGMMEDEDNPDDGLADVVRELELQRPQEPDHAFLDEASRQSTSPKLPGSVSPRIHSPSGKASSGQALDFSGPPRASFIRMQTSPSSAQQTPVVPPMTRASTTSAAGYHSVGAGPPAMVGTTASRRQRSSVMGLGPDPSRVVLGLPHGMSHDGLPESDSAKPTRPRGYSLNPEGMDSMVDARALSLQASPDKVQNSKARAKRLRHRGHTGEQAGPSSGGSENEEDLSAMDGESKAIDSVGKSTGDGASDLAKTNRGRPREGSRPKLPPSLHHRSPSRGQKPPTDGQDGLTPGARQAAVRKNWIDRQRRQVFTSTPAGGQGGTSPSLKGVEGDPPEFSLDPDPKSPGFSPSHPNGNQGFSPAAPHRSVGLKIQVQDQALEDPDNSSPGLHHGPSGRSLGRPPRSDRSLSRKGLVKTSSLQPDVEQGHSGRHLSPAGSGGVEPSPSGAPRDTRDSISRLKTVRVANAEQRARTKGRRRGLACGVCETLLHWIPGCSNDLERSVVLAVSLFLLHASVSIAISSRYLLGEPSTSKLREYMMDVTTADVLSGGTVFNDRTSLLEYQASCVHSVPLPLLLVLCIPVLPLSVAAMFSSTTFGAVAVVLSRLALGLLTSDQCLPTEALISTSMFVLALFVGLWDAMGQESLARRALLQRLASRRAKTQADSVLEQLLPTHVNEKLRRNEPVPFEMHPNHVVMLWADLVGFTALSATLQPHQVMKILNSLYSRFDALVERASLWKVDTIGDAYVIIGGLVDARRPKEAGSRRPESTDLPGPELVERMFRVASSMREQVRDIAQTTGQDIGIRIGIHSGPVATGIIGTLRPRWHVFGPTVLEAEQMESEGRRAWIQVSEAAFRLYNTRGFSLLERVRQPEPVVGIELLEGHPAALARPAPKPRVVIAPIESRIKSVIPPWLDAQEAAEAVFEANEAEESARRAGQSWTRPPRIDGKGALWSFWLHPNEPMRRAIQLTAQRAAHSDVPLLMEGEEETVGSPGGASENAAQSSRQLGLQGSADSSSRSLKPQRSGMMRSRMGPDGVPQTPLTGLLKNPGFDFPESPTYSVKSATLRRPQLPSVFADMLGLPPSLAQLSPMVIGDDLEEKPSKPSRKRAKRNIKAGLRERTKQQHELLMKRQGALRQERQGKWSPAGGGVVPFARDIENSSEDLTAHFHNNDDDHPLPVIAAHSAGSGASFGE
jgi:class 3 adenylate cyclase